MTTNHTHCLHPATKAGRAACRRNGTGFAYDAQAALELRARRARESAPCQDCLMVAFGHVSNDIAEDDDTAWIIARGWLFDDGAISACPDHEHLLD